MTCLFSDVFVSGTGVGGNYETANKIITNLNVGICSNDNTELEVIETILRYVEDNEKSINDKTFITQKDKINDGMWSWEEWNINTGLGSDSRAESEEGGEYYKYKIAWKKEKMKQKKAIANVRER